MQQWSVQRSPPHSPLRRVRGALSVTDSSDLRLDPHNANRGTQRGEGMVERSLQAYGAGRSILASRDGIILAGNKTYAKAVELGIPVREIESDGRTLFVIKRTDLSYDDPRARELAIADNRASETGLEWDADVLTALADEGVDLSQFWFEDELSKILEAAADDILAEDDGIDEIPEQWMVLIECADEREQASVLERLSAEGLRCRALTS